VCSASAKYGKEFRSLFTVPSGYKLVGCDVSGLELRCLSSYLVRWDSGAYRKELLEGDIHTANQMASGVPTRDKAKTFIYAFLYGAGDKKIGEIVKGTAKEGKILKQTFLSKTPAIKKLRETVIQNFKQRGFLYAIDRRRIHPRSEHSALNFLLQSCGSIIVKKATILLHKNLSHLKYGEDWGMVAHIHDEMQLQVKEHLAEEVGKVAVDSIKQTQNYFKFNCELDGEYKIGNNWAETH
jgi:DNA polymerase I-like protein with 3'-5' exonuclease and polymerase domains